jgi:hypothetical protein
MSIDMSALRELVIKIRESNGRPSPRTKFYFLSAARGGSSGLTTDDRGEATLLVGPGMYSVALGPPTPRSIRFEIGADEPQQRIIELSLP